MLFLDYSREDGEWEPNIFGGRENLEAIAFMREMNEAVYSAFPDVQTIAEESTSFPMVSKPTLYWWSGVWNEMDDGVDARYPSVFCKRTHLPKASSK